MICGNRLEKFGSKFIMKYSTIVAVMILILSGSLFAQNELQFDFDYARFKYDQSSDYLEFYYSLNSRGMVLTDYGDKKLVEAVVHIEMKNTATDSFFINKSWQIHNIINPTDSLGKMNVLTGTFGMAVPEGDYQLNITASDANNSEFDKKISENIKIQPYLNSKFSISDIQLASNIKRVGVDTNSIFYKNTLEVIPNPTMLFTENSPVAFYYSELYNLTADKQSNEFTLDKLLYNSSGVNVYKSSKKIHSNQNSVVEIGVLNLSKLPTDSYNFVLNLIDNKTNQAFLSSKRFFLYNPKVIDSTAVQSVNANIFGTEFGIMSAEECDKMFDQAKYIATQDEKQRYKSLDSLNAKRDFLAHFWKGRDLEPATPQNEYEIDYLKRVEYANEHFRYANREGYRSDRGRVYLIYGEPDQKDYYPSDSNMKPYEVWFYNDIEGGVYFYFGDINGFGKYELLHSTKRGEVKDANWMRRISSN